MAFELDGIEQVEETELAALLNEKGDETIVVDVREPEEYEAGHIPGLPLLPMSSIPAVVAEMDKEKSYIFVCRSGSRSQNVALYLKDQGFRDVKNYAGGMLEWTGEVTSGLEWFVKEIGRAHV